MDTEERDGNLQFVFNCACGHNVHIGDLASWSESLGWFSDKSRDKDETEETNIAFIIDGVLWLHRAATEHYQVVFVCF